MNLFFLPPLILQTFVYPLTWIALRFFTHLRIEGRDNVRGMKKGVIFAVNHSSELDVVLVPATLPFLSPLMPMFYVSLENSLYQRPGEKSISRYFYGGLLFRVWGAYPAAVGVGDYELALKHHLRILSHGKSVCIFPEGRVTRDGTLGEGKAGVAYLLWRTGVPIVPVAISGNYKMTFRGFFSRRRSVTVSYGTPILAADLFGPRSRDGVPPSQEELKGAAKVIMSRIRELWRP